MYICPSEGKVSCVFALAFRDKTDEEIANVFMKVSDDTASLTTQRV